MAWRERRRKKRIHELLESDPRFRVSVFNRDWLCPYCLQIAVPDTSAGEIDELILAHVNECPKAEGLEGNPVSLALLQRTAETIAFDRQITVDPAFRVFDPDGKWICPYCSTFFEFTRTFDPKEPSANAYLVKQVRKHLDACRVYDQNPGQPMKHKAVLQVLAEEKKRRAVTDQVADLAKREPIFKFETKDRRWVCPYCLEVVSYIDMSTPLLRDHSAPRQIAKHLLSNECTAFAAGQRTTKSEPELRAAVERINATIQEPQRVQEPSKDMGDTHYLKEMKAELSALRDELSENKALKKSLGRAQKAQARMLPKEPPPVAGYEFAAHYKASEMVSGDFYDFVDLKNNRVGIVIGDVSGHGIEAGLVMGMTKKAFQIRAGSGNLPAKVLADVNGDIFPDLEQGTFVTAFYALLDANQHKLYYARAGHNFSLLYTPSTSHLEMLKSRGLMLGANKGPLFEKAIEELAYDVKPGQVFLQYTDGVTEAMNAEHEEFEFERLCQALAKYGAGTAQQIIDGILHAIEDFTQGHPQEDDITFVCIRRTAPSRSAVSRTKGF